MSALSLKCSQCGTLLKSAEEAKQHMESTGHTNFEESTEAVLQLVCKTCGKPCRSQTEKDLHMKRNPGHCEFVDQTAGAGPVDYTIEKEDPMDLDPELRKAIAAATGKDIESIEKAAAAKAPAEAGPKQRVTELVNKELMAQLAEMGFPEVRAEKGLWLTGNESLENAINWLAEHSEDADIDVPLEVDAATANKPKLSKEEQKKLLEERLAKNRENKAKQDKELEKQQELSRIAMNKELNEALKKQKEQEEKLAAERERKRKEQDKADRERIKKKLEQDKLERLAAKGIKPEEAVAAAKVEKPADPYKERKLNLSSKLRDIIGFHRNDPTSPNPGTKALETANKYVENIMNNPTDEKFRSINMENAAFQRLLGGKKGGPEVLLAIGFVEQDGKLVVTDLDVEWLKVASGELQVAAKRGPFY